jgi:hypothetical protein
MVGMFSMAAVGLMVMSQGCSSNNDTPADAGSDAAVLPAPGVLITDFGTAPSMVGTFYQGSGQGWATPTVTTDGSLHFTFDTGASTGMYAYVYVGLPFNNGPVNGSGATGVTFTASGTLSGTACAIQFSLVDQDHATTANNGHCDTVANPSLNCYPSSKIFTLAATPTPVTVLYADQTGGSGASTTTPPAVNPTQILNAQWQVQSGAGAVGDNCKGDITIDDFKWQ